MILLLSSTFLGTMSAQLLADNSSLGSTANKQKNCQIWPEIVKNMPIGTATITLGSGQKTTFQYRLADTAVRMQHGFQRTCAQTIETTQMLFKFTHPQKPAFHMNNVVAPLDIAFIDENGKITDVLLMKTYSVIDLKKPLYSPSKTVLYALEARAGYFADLGVKVGDHVEIEH